jgi:hypothetical protein
MKTVALAAFCALISAVSGCSPSVKISVGSDLKTVCDFSVSLDAQLASRLGARATDNSVAAPSPLFDLALIQRSFQAAGFADVTATSLSAGELAVRAEAASPVAAFSAVPNVVRYTALSNGSGGQIEIAVSKETISEILAIMPDGISEYLDLLMAPLFTGENLTETEYLAVIASVYGQQTADMLKKSTLDIHFALPARADIRYYPDAAKVSVSGNNVSLFLPLASVLSAQTELAFCAVW